jgi:signal peptide peptidase SppA
MATQVNRLREEITAILNIADASRGDRVIIQLNSGGGTVTGYGLGAAQLLRIKNAGLHLTVSVDEIAASGGYLMASVADKIVASPFAVLGSSGVVATIPNFSERMTREGVVVEDVTAGKYKRTMTPYKKTTDQDRAKMKSDVESILTIFKDFLKQNRPTLAVDEVATGEIWHGPDALKKGLVDELVTTDDLILKAYESGFEVYAVQVKPKQPTFAELMEEDKANQQASVGSVISTWFVGMLSSVFARVMQETAMRVANGPALQGRDGTATMGDLSGEYPVHLEERPVNHTLLAMDFNTPPKFT